jgi:hypothetical protein
LNALALFSALLFALIPHVRVGGGGLPGSDVAQSVPFIISALETYAPIVAAAIVTVVLVRTGASQKLAEYRRETMEMIRTRADLLEKQLAEAQAEITELQREVRRRDRRIEDLEYEVGDLRGQMRAHPPYAVRPPQPHVPLEKVDEGPPDATPPAAGNAAS